MSDVSLIELRRFFVERYDSLKTLLHRRLGSGSADLVSDALHDTYVRLAEKDKLETSVQSPQAFLLRTATNIAIDRIRRDARMLGGDEIDALLAQESVLPDPADVLLGKLDLDAAVHALEKMPARRRQILLAVRFEGVSQKELATRYGISLRLVERELCKAHDDCAQAMRR